MTVIDIAECILKKTGAITAMKLQKLVYYTQAWHLVIKEKPAFEEKIEAWANGPVVPSLYRVHRKHFMVETVGGDCSKVSSSVKSIITPVLKVYGKRTALELSDLTHSEAPWKDARIGIENGVNSKREITKQKIFDYYSSLTAKNVKEK